MYQQEGCNVGKNGFVQVVDVDVMVCYMLCQLYVDVLCIVVVGMLYGGFVLVVYGIEVVVGVCGIINFFGGLCQDLCDGWQCNFVDVFDQYGVYMVVWLLWLYGDNDLVWMFVFVVQMYDVYVLYGM